MLQMSSEMICPAIQYTSRRELINRFFSQHECSLGSASEHDSLNNIAGMPNASNTVFSAVFEQSPVGQILLDRNGNVLAINATLCELLSLNLEQPKPVTWNDIRGTGKMFTFDGSPLNDSNDPMKTSLRDGVEIEGRIMVKNHDTSLWVSITIFPVIDDSGDILAIAATMTDITGFKEVQEMLYYQATHDPLTGLANRALFSATLTNALSRSKRTHLGGAVMALDLDRFKEVNDTYGHPAGDELLVKVSSALLSEVRGMDIVARIGGDEFAILLSDIAYSDLKIAGIIAGKICKALSTPFEIQGNKVSISVSIGISFFPLDGFDEKVLIAKADSAMYHVKGGERNGWKFWSDAPGRNKV